MTIRVTNAVVAEAPRIQSLRDLFWTQGLAALVVFTLFALPMTSCGRSLRRWCLLIFVAALVASMFSGPYEPMRYHGPPVIAMFAAAGVVAAEAFYRWPKWAPAIVGVLLALPAGQAVGQIVQQRANRVDSDPTAWIERHVPPRHACV